MNSWPDLVAALHLGENDEVVKQVFLKIDETPKIVETPENYNDPLGKTKFYKFLKTGLEFGFRYEKLNHVHLFVQSHEAYSAYNGDIFGKKAQNWSYKAIVDQFGHPSKEGGGTIDMLIGYVQPWVSYDFDQYSFRVEFTADGGVWKVTLMGRKG
ncbi:MAG: hypothetical protein ABWZ65_05340 [Pseudomonas mandelii]